MRGNKNAPHARGAEKPLLNFKSNTMKNKFWDAHFTVGVYLE